MSRIYDQLWDDLVELDRMMKVVGYGGKKRTISAELGRRLTTREASALDEAVCEVLDVFEDCHCVRSHEREDE